MLIRQHADAFFLSEGVQTHMKFFLKVLYEHIGAGTSPAMAGPFSVEVET